ncbi:MAG: barstar family protein [Oscillospiraceae bacterium]|nr:barstar family protein [Oscillospiraceae bacterium]
MERTAILDLTDCKYIMDFHERAKKTLRFPDFYGYNWSAFWDSLSMDSPIDFVTIKGAHTISKELQPALEQMLEIFERCKNRRKKLELSFDYVIED